MLRLALQSLAVAVVLLPCAALALRPGAAAETLPASAPIVPARARVAAPSVGVDRTPKTDLAALPNRCARLTVVGTPTGPRFSKQLPAWLRDPRARRLERRRLRQLIDLVAVEVMGADQSVADYLWLRAIEESGGFAGTLHTMAADVDAHRGADRFGEGTPWADLRIGVWTPEGERVGLISAWRFGRGLHGMHSGWYHHWWPESPPWWPCDEVAEIIAAVWTLRTTPERCGASTLRVAHARFAGGTCDRSRRRDRAIERLGRGRPRNDEPTDVRFAPDAVVSFGEHGNASTPEARAALHGRATALAVEHGLLRR